MAVRVATRGNRRGTQRVVASATVFACAIVAAAFLLSRRPVVERAAASPAPVVGVFDTIQLPVPSIPVPAGLRVREIKTVTVSFPRHQVPDGAVTDLAPFKDAVVMVPLPANLPLFSKNFGSQIGGENAVVEKIPPGMRAMTISVDATSSVEGWAGSGSTVDVLLIEKDRTSVVAEKVRILSAERSVHPVEGASSPAVPSTVTLLVSQDQCLAINTAIPLGKIAFALRSARDEERWTTTTYTAERLKGSPGAGAKRGIINGYVALSQGAERRQFALVDGKWMSSEIKPEGFLVGEDPSPPARGDHKPIAVKKQ